VVGAVGLGFSSEAVLTREIAEELRLLIVSHSSSSPALTSFPWFARTVPTDTWQGQALAALLSHMQVQSATVVFCPDSYCRGLASSLRHAANTHGIAISEVSEAAFSLGTYIGQDCTRWNEVIVLATWASYVFDLYHLAEMNPEYSWGRAIWLGKPT